MADAPQGIFISHAATPEDTELTRWLALRLMRDETKFEFNPGAP